MGEYYEVKPFLDELFADSLELMIELSAKTGEFTLK